MAQYTPKTWTTGETITAAELNAIEQAAAAAQTATDAAAAQATASTADRARANHTGTQSADTLTDGTTNKAFLATERTKLAGVATGATANATDAALRDRSTHTGTQAASTVTGLSTVATSGAYTDLTGRPAIPAALPTQTNNAGKFLTTDGTITSWGTPAGGGGAASWTNRDGLALTPVDGGPDFFQKYRYRPRTDPYFFPVGLYYPTVASAGDITTHTSAGINYYHHLTNSSDLSLLAGTGIPAVLNADIWASSYSTWQNNGSIMGVALNDERDMVYNGMGDPQTQGFADQQAQLDSLAKDGRFIQANYGKGVAFYASDTSAARYVNSFQDIISVDVYFMTDPDSWQQYQGGKYVNGSTAALTQAQGQRGYMYGLLIQRLRSLISPAASKPVFSIVELSRTNGTPGAPASISTPQIKSAVWHSLIAGARGVIYFNQQFTDNNVLVDDDVIKHQPTIRTAVTGINSLVTQMAPVLNAPSVAGFVTTSSAVAFTVRFYNGDYYLIAGSTQTASQTANFTVNVAGFTTAAVMGEARSVTLSGTTLSDTFADQDAVHIYKLAKG